MRLYTEKNPKFSDSIKITDTTDPGNANLINEAAKQLIQNDLVIKKRIEQCLGEDPEHGNSQDMVVTFDSGDNTSAGEWTNVAAIQNGETHKLLFGKISTMFKNVRYLYKLLGTTDISSIGDGTVTNAIKKLKEDQPDAATQSVAGLLSADDKKKLDEIATKANNYTHPTTHAASMITQDTTHRFVSDTEKNAWDNKLNKTDVTRSTAVTVEGQKALDAVEKNAAVPGTMAYDLAQINSKIVDAGIIFANASSLSHVQYNSIKIANMIAFRLYCTYDGTIEAGTWYKIGSINTHVPAVSYPLTISCPQSNAWIGNQLVAHVESDGGIYISSKEKMWNAIVILSGIWFVP